MRRGGWGAKGLINGGEEVGRYTFRWDLNGMSVQTSRYRSWSAKPAQISGQLSPSLHCARGGCGHARAVDAELANGTSDVIRVSTSTRFKMAATSCNSAFVLLTVTASLVRAFFIDRGDVSKSGRCFCGK